MSVKVTLNCELQVEKQMMLKAFLTENLPNVRNFNGCTEVLVYFENAKSHMLIEEEWESIEHHQRYMEYIQDNGVLTQLAQFFTAAPVIRYYNKQDL